MLIPDPQHPSLKAYRRSEKPAHDAAIAGTFFRLLDMIDGELDGDALFFTRDLKVEGDTEAVVTLRNALDDMEGSAMDSVLCAFGPLRGTGEFRCCRCCAPSEVRTNMADGGFQRPELVCPAGTPAGLRTAVDAGADTVYCGLQNATNARNFPGLNFTPAELEQAVAYAHEHGAKVLLAVNTFPPAGQFDLWREAIDLAPQRRRRCGDRRRYGRGRLRRLAPIRTSGCISRSRAAPPRRRRSASIARRSASSAWCCRAC